MSSGGAPQLSSAFIDLFASQTEPEGRLSTYGELESYLYGNPTKASPYMQIKHKKIIGFISLAIILYYLKKK